MTASQIIALASPVFLLAILCELWLGKRRQRDTYRLNDAFNSLSLGILSQIAGLFTSVLMLGTYAWVWRHAAWAHWAVDSPLTWVVALVGYDFCYYWLHRAGHRVAVLWAAHVVHHQSEDYNLSTALRQTASGNLLGWVFYLPLALVGLPPLVFGVVALVDLLYQFWVHTQQIDRLGWFDRWFCSPSNHRAHHAVNDRYLDKNYGGIFMVWDRMFGTFVEEDPSEPVVFGTRKPLRSWNPLWANLEVYAALLRDSLRTRRWRDKVQVWFRPPGWRPLDVAQRWPDLPFDIHRRRWDPPLSATRIGVAWVLGLSCLTAALGLLWYAHLLPWAELAAGSGLIVAGLWILGRVCDPRVSTLPTSGR